MENPACYASRQCKDALAHVLHVKHRRALERQKAAEACHELAQRMIVAPRNQFEGTETIRKIGVGEYGNPGVFGVGAKKPDPAAFAEARSAVLKALGRPN